MSDTTAAGTSTTDLPAQSTGSTPTGPNKPGGGGSGSSGRSLPAGATQLVGLILALGLLVVAGGITAGDQFLTTDNMVNLLSQGAVIGVIAIGMTFVITGGGIDLSVGAVTALASVWATTTGTQALGEDIHWMVLVTTAVFVGAVCGLVNGALIAYGRVVPFIATLAMLAGARGLAEIISDRQTQLVDNPGFFEFFRSEPLGIPVLVIIFLVVSVLGWVLLNRTTFGRRTFAVGGNPEAARLAGINVKRHTMLLYVLVGATAGIAAVMLMARTTTGTSTHGQLYELDAIAAVVIGGTLLAGGRGTIVGTVLGVLIFATLTNVFIINNLNFSVQSVAKGVIIIVAVLLQQFFASRSKT